MGKKNNKFNSFTKCCLLTGDLTKSRFVSQKKGFEQTPSNQPKELHWQVCIIIQMTM